MLPLTLAILNIANAATILCGKSLFGGTFTV
jgi:hypothetical protein